MTEAQGGKGSIKLRQCPPGDPVVGFFGAVLRGTRSISSRNSLHWETPAHRTRALSGVRQSFLELSCLSRESPCPLASLCPALSHLPHASFKCSGLGCQCPTFGPNRRDPCTPECVISPCVLQRQ